jgi:HD-like signal output (HDOD) protein
MFAPTLKQIFEVAEKLPSAPQILAELSELLEDTNSDIDDIGNLLRRDGVLAAAVLRMSNSVYYGSGGVGSIEAAVNRVGFGEVHRLVGCAATGVLADRALTFYGIEAQPLREHMVCMALAAEALATATEFNPRHAYTAGLLRPIGIMVLDRMARSGLSSKDMFNLERDHNYAEWEGRVLQIRNAAVTAVVLAEWRFARDVVEAERGHCLLPGATLPTRGAGLLNIAGWLVHKLGFGLQGEEKLWELAPDRLSLAGITQEHVNNCVEQVKSNFENLRAALH